MVLYGDNDTGFEGVIPNLERRFRTSESDFIKEMIAGFMSVQPCPECFGQRLNKASLHVLIDKKNISDICEMSIIDAKNILKILS